MVASTKKSTFSEHILNKGHDMEEIMMILHFVNDPNRMNALKEMEIIKAGFDSRHFCNLKLD